MQVHAERAAAQQEGVHAFVEQVIRHVLAAFQRGQRAADRGRGLADAGRAANQEGRAGHQPAAQQPVQSGGAGGLRHCQELASMFGSHQAREHLQAAGGEDEVVKAAAEFQAAHLDDPQPPPLRAELMGGVFEVDDALEIYAQTEI